ncbi:hypothetical protein GBAR_LOCUS12410 [Geodia barretti]|uniref:Uncharacterized protein n=1 Tax=Geodia barretti TaxID=519541 RepID=A0AA35S1B9_GEOBA|nr:hypothetical protein GBAR_LOCUS12410 [Geodia barretti]
MPLQTEVQSSRSRENKTQPPMLKPSNKIEDSLQAPDQPPPVPPKKQHSPRISGTRQSASVTDVLQQGFSVHTSTEERREWTRRSPRKWQWRKEIRLETVGMESGSGSVQHGTISQWREAIKKPPPEPKNYPPKEGEKMDECVSETNKRYTHLREETIDRVGPYEKVNYGSPLP